jgi:hypothetical protein
MRMKRRGNYVKSHLKSITGSSSSQTGGSSSSRVDDMTDSRIAHSKSGGQTAGGRVTGRSTPLLLLVLTGTVVFRRGTAG